MCSDRFLITELNKQTVAVTAAVFFIPSTDINLNNNDYQMLLLIEWRTLWPDYLVQLNRRWL